MCTRVFWNSNGVAMGVRPHAGLGDERRSAPVGDPAGVFGVVRNCQVPYGAPDNRFDTYPTWWASVTDLTERVYYFQSTRAPNVVWLELDAVDLSAGSDARSLDPRNPELVGALHQDLEPAELHWGVG